jgi:hypothetical protein
MQLIVKYQEVAEDPLKLKAMQTKTYKAEWSRFGRVFNDEMNAVRAQLVADGIPLDENWRRQAAEQLENRRLMLGKSMPQFVKDIATKYADEKRRNKVSQDD